MEDIVSPLETKFLKNQLKYLEVIILFISNDIDMLVEVIF